MIKFIVLLCVLFVGLLFGHTLIGVEGRVIIALPETVIELSIISTLIIAFFAVLAFWLLEWLFKKIIRTVMGSKTWLGALSKRQQTQAFYNSINAMLLNDNATAVKLIAKTMNGDFKGTNALIAAELEMQAGNYAKAQAFLMDAADSPITKNIALMKQANIAMLNQQAQEAMNLLSGVEGKVRGSKYFVQLKLSILAALEDWPQVQTFAASHKKLLADDYITWASQCASGEFAAIASKHGAKALQEHWKALPRQARKNQENQISYVQLLIDAGLHSDAEQELLTHINKQSTASQWPLMKQLVLPNSSALLRQIEKEIKASPTNHNLFSVLAHLAYNSHNIELARKAASKSLELKDNTNDKLLLAKILEQSSDYQGANALYQNLAASTH